MLNIIRRIKYSYYKNNFCEHLQKKYYCKDITENTYEEYQYCCRCGRKRKVIHSLGETLYCDWEMPTYDKWCK